MNIANILIIIAVGCCGMLAQGLLMRELVVTFIGNELTVGIILSHWIISEAAGVLFFGRFCDRFKDIRVSLAALNLLFSTGFIFSFFFARSFKAVFGFAVGQGPDLGIVIWGSFLAVFLPAASHGALFSALASLMDEKRKSSPLPREAVGRTYLWETLGTMLGGILLTYVFAQYFPGSAAAFTVFAGGVLIAAVLTRAIGSRLVRLNMFVLLGAVILISMQFSPGELERRSQQLRYPVGKVIASRYSQYGSIVVVEKEGQRTVFANGSGVITSPAADMDFIEQYAGFCVLSHRAPRSILVICGGAGGLINEFLKYPVERIDYVESDPELFSVARAYAGPLVRSELTDQRVSLQTGDGRSLLGKPGNKYDLIVLGISAPSTLSMNRLFTREFFSAARERLTEKGQVCLWLPGSLTFSSKPLLELSGSILAAVRAEFPVSRIIPGDNMIVLASLDPALGRLEAGTLMERLEQYQYRPMLFTRRLLDYRLDQRWAAAAARALAGSSLEPNRDFHPNAVLAAVRTWNQATWPWGARLFEGFLRAGFLAQFFSFLLLLICSGLVFGRRIKNFSYSLFSTGFLGMAVTVFLLLAYQIQYGNFYRQLGLLIAAFMAGTAIGAAAAQALQRRWRFERRMIDLGELAQMAFIFALAALFFALKRGMNLHPVIFAALFLACGSLVGAQFILVAAGRSRQKDGAAGSASALYFSDLLGSWIAGMSVGSILLPAWGAAPCAVLVFLFKAAGWLLERRNNR